jgi:hypothetical protein
MRSDLGASGDHFDAPGKSELADRSHEPPRLLHTPVEQHQRRRRDCSSQHEAGNAGAAAKVEDKLGLRQLRTGVEVGEGVDEVGADISGTEAACSLRPLEQRGEFLDQPRREPRAIRRRRRRRRLLRQIRQKAPRSQPGE